MIIHFSDDLGLQDIYANGVELPNIMGRDLGANGSRLYTLPDEYTMHVASIKNPVLMTNHYELSKFPSTTRETLFKLYESPVKTVCFRGVSLSFEQARFPGVWGPSIDTLFLCKALDSGLSGVSSALEVGSGSGYVGKFVLEHSNLNSLDLIDLNQLAIDCAKSNIVDSRVNFFVGDAKAVLNNSLTKYDLIMCNPPYVPRPKSVENNPYEGLGLVRYVLDNYDKLLSDSGSFVTISSSVSRSLFESFTDELGLKIEELASMSVPFKITTILNNNQWMDYLLGNGLLKKDYHDGFDYWHKISVLKIN